TGGVACRYVGWLALPTAGSIVVLFACPDPAATVIYTLSLHDALPISPEEKSRILPVKFWPLASQRPSGLNWTSDPFRWTLARQRSEEHTSELQSRFDIVCRHLLEKKKPSLSIRTLRLILPATRPLHFP